MSVVVQVNGTRHEVDADPDTPLLWVLRDTLGLTGTKYGCGIGICGACTVHENGSAVRSCQIRLADATAKAYTTIEGLSHPCQRAWLDEDVAQCGYCQPGMLMEAASLLRAHKNPTLAQIEAAFDGHVCRCGTYPRILLALARVTKA
jgi:isoquinoline 1-oxidoreductase subunit alpha